MDKFYEVIERKKKILKIKEKFNKLTFKIFMIYIIIDIILYNIIINSIDITEIIETKCSVTFVDFNSKKYVNYFEINNTTLIPVEAFTLKAEDLGDSIDCIIIDKTDIVIEKVKYNIVKYDQAMLSRNIIGKMMIFTLISMFLSLPFIIFLGYCEIKNEKEIKLMSV